MKRYFLSEACDYSRRTPTVVTKGTPEDILAWAAEHIDPVKGLGVFLEKLKGRLRYGTPLRGSAGHGVVFVGIDYGRMKLLDAEKHGWLRSDAMSLRLILDPLEKELKVTNSPFSEEAIKQIAERGLKKPEPQSKHIPICPSCGNTVTLTEGKYVCLSCGKPIDPPAPQSKHVPVCKKCGYNGVHYEFHDAYYCAQCNKWLEPSCSDGTFPPLPEKPEPQEDEYVRACSSKSRVIALQGTPEQILERTKEIIEEERQRKKEWECWARDLPALPVILDKSSRAIWWSLMVGWLKRMPRR